MIVGVKHIDLQELGTIINTNQNLSEYSEQLVPRIIRHDIRIVNNQKYLVSLYVREMKAIPWKKREELFEKLLEDVSLTGDCTTMIEFEDILRETNVDMLADYLLRDKGVSKS